MLSRVADSLYWMARYVERAENLARLLQASTEILLDGQTFGRNGAVDSYWSPVLAATASEELFDEHHPAGSSADVGFFLALSQENPDSIRMCIATARENARTVRDQISDEMWTALNELHLFLSSRGAVNAWQRSPQQLCERIVHASLLFGGITDGTMQRAEGWNFIRLGQHLERADKTTRLLDMPCHSEGDSGDRRFRDLDEVQWISILRSASAFGTYRTNFGSEVAEERVMDLLIFSTVFPRAVRYCLREVDSALHDITGTPPGTFCNEAERVAGRMLSRLNFGAAGEVEKVGLHRFVDDLQKEFNELGQAIFETYVLLPQEANRVVVPAAWENQIRSLREEEMQQQQQQQQ